ncbi:MAG TPA: single-stranded DNA-binding protein, partial [Candidatus Cloacimonadota bacterium]|nr:single-stranded DNA-binding protein [Candidatus Cloacimonadota bacterium]
MSELRFPKINSIMLSGRATRDAEIKTLANGTLNAKISMAFDRSYKKGNEWVNETSYIDVIAWSKLAENSGVIRKGDPLIIEGYLQVRDWKDNQNISHKQPEIIASRIHQLLKSETTP